MNILSNLDKLRGCGFSISPFRPILKKAQLHNIQRLMYHSYTKDIVLYRYSRPTFFRVIGITCISQVFFWTYLGHFIFTELRSSWNVLPGKKTELPLRSSDSINNDKKLASWKLRAGLASLSVGGGCVLAATGFLYAWRSVSGLVLLKRNAGLLVTTYTPIGTQRSFSVALDSVKVIGSRTEKRQQIPMKIKGSPFFYLLDIQGDFPQPSVFDTSIGIKRGWHQ